MREALSPLVDLIYPPRCPLCGDAIAAQDGLCSGCWSGLDVPDIEEDGVVAATLYNDAARRLVLSFKHGKRIGLAPMMARMMAAQVQARIGAMGADWTLVPVPLHPVRLWQRGFNQSALIARQMAKPLGARLLVDGLKRTRRTPSLGGLGRAERAAVLTGAIAVNPARRSRLEGASVLLVDDVLTSGATSRACMAALRDAGAVRVTLACFSRVAG